ncbi:ATP phosphoribosyltransferase [Propionicimonas sp.]|uniref:ATP phosphoribosyltransferase n=1 Tax=Propionicimonas sp. TaxID=1955623 RepID=UPI0017D4B653|nr:ATP phosphoribosyltransferase [Propionicimonas sp.]MBU3976245.1 ATP phosphoribosyltransferase [Actinomycetota bacterium]MBA3021057.1 ATP phosphoribosyltransferase [Propionicimonas sp.]MBU3985640.1 ATP phosphoribosyltransferase [Actinomycetota bacterium]MBU4008425.1 ATP phosphoribosyltransferase [Actinomycetota bacterium]MBU4066425.1 ATP phosphoribosyltransferase [Actinomycetota bacterium]
MATELLKIAVPNKGSLAEGAAEMLREAGYRQRHDAKDLVLVDETNGVEFYYLRPRDIAVYVGEGTLDLGITGRDMLLDSGAEADEVISLGFGGTRFRFAAPGGAELSLADLAGKRIATSYAGLVGAYLDQAGISARLIHLDGAVESSVRLGVADVVADVVETGTTLKRAGLELFGEAILESEAVLIQRRGVAAPDGLDLLVRRLNGVLTARDYLMVDYNVPTELLAVTTAVTPGLDAPTVSPLAKEGWVAVRAMIPAKRAQQIMDELWEAGAEGILVTSIHACRL